MTLYLIGLGLYDEKDITIRGFEAIESCDTIYLEHYTSILSIDKDKLEAFYGSPVTLAPRDLVESRAEELLLKPAKDKNVALLVVGDVFGATTHTDLMLRAKEMGVEVVVIFNASIMNAIGITGLELYKFGKTTSIVFLDDNWLPQTPYDVIKQNKLEYGIQFMVSGSTLKHALNMATLNSKTDIGNNFRARCKKDVDNLNNDTFEFFASMLEDGVLVVSGFPTSLPDVPETPEQRKRTVISTYTQMDKNERAELIKYLQDNG